MANNPSFKLQVCVHAFRYLQLVSTLAFHQKFHGPRAKQPNLEDIPNQDKGPFHRIWNKKAPDYCDCGSKIRANAQYCQKCRPNPLLDSGKRKLEISEPRDDDNSLTRKIRRISM